MGVFKSYDIRGVYPTELDATLARKIGVSLGRHYLSLPENQGKKSLRLVVGRDMRASAPEMAAGLIDGLRAVGHHVIDIGMVTTPCTYFAIQHLRADGGVQCTASHNPPQYIGYKVCRELAIPISLDTGLNAVQANLDAPAPTGPPGAKESVDVGDAYLDFLMGMAKVSKPIRVAADGSNGMVGMFLERLFARLPATLTGIYLEPDGSFPNHDADPLKPENLRDLRKLVVDTKSAIGFCFDGDADRVAIVDDQGGIVGCDLITALLCQEALQGNSGRPCTYDLRSSKVVRDVIEDAGGKAVRSRVGHSHVKQSMRSMNALCGGELSGHYYFQLQGHTTFYADSALVAMVRLLNILGATDQSISQLLAPLRKYHHTGEINFAIKDKDAALDAIRKTFADARQDELDGVTCEYSNWWVNVRPSNTEPLLRLTLEGDTPALRDAGYEKVFALLSKFGERVTGHH